jgi:hypothetical protein
MYCSENLHNQEASDRAVQNNSNIANRHFFLYIFDKFDTDLHRLITLQYISDKLRLNTYLNLHQTKVRKVTLYGQR